MVQMVVSERRNCLSGLTDDRRAASVNRETSLQRRLPMGLFDVILSLIFAILDLVFFFV